MQYFDDFLAALNSRKRKAVKKERRESRARGLEIEVLTGADLKPRHWDAFFKVSPGASDRKWGSAYLNRISFALIGERMPEKVVLVMARRDSDYVAGAFNLLGSDTIYGPQLGQVTASTNSSISTLLIKQKIPAIACGIHACWRRAPRVHKRTTAGLPAGA